MARRRARRRRATGTCSPSTCSSRWAARSPTATIWRGFDRGRAPAPGRLSPHARETILSQRYTATIMRLARWFEARGWRDQPVTEDSARLMAPLGKVAPALILRGSSQGAEARAAFRDAPPLAPAPLRIALKKLRYATEFLGPLFGSARRPAIAGAAEAAAGRSRPCQRRALGARHWSRISATAPRARLDRAGGIVVGWHGRGVADSRGADARAMSAASAAPSVLVGTSGGRPAGGARSQACRCRAASRPACAKSMPRLRPRRLISIPSSRATSSPATPKSES